MPGDTPPTAPVTPPVTPPAAGTPPPVAPPATPPATPPAGAPEKYADFKLPEGAKLDGETLTAFTDFARKLGLSQEHAQAFVDREIAIQRDADAYAAEAIKKQAAEWESAGRQDPEFGGAKYDENLGVATKALDAFASPALKDMLKTLPIGKHPEVVRFLVKIGKAIAEDKFVPAGGSPQPDPLRALYPSMFKTG